MNPKILILMAFFGTTFGGNATKGIAQNISADESQKMIQERLGQNDFVLLDVRTLMEYRSGYIKGSEHLDLFAPDFRNRVAAMDKEKTYLLYCRSGNRSGNAMQMMASMGFKKVYNMMGGIGTWYMRGYAIEQ